VENFRESLGEALVGNHLIGPEIQGGRANAGAVLHGRGCFGRERRGDGGPAVLAKGLFGAVLGDFEANGREFENLPALAAFAFKGFRERVRGQGRTAFGTGSAGLKAMLRNMIGVGGLVQGVAGMTLLPSGFFAGLAPQALGFALGRIGEIALIRRGRLAAGAAIAFQGGDFEFQSFDAVQELEHQIGDGFGVALGKLDEFLPGWTVSAHSRELGQEGEKINFPESFWCQQPSGT
jgi:hypothetical protein